MDITRKLKITLRLSEEDLEPIPSPCSYMSAIPIIPGRKYLYGVAPVIQQHMIPLMKHDLVCIVFVASPKRGMDRKF
jgi:hypothetical protein